ncbi:MAG: hypothetical protein Q7J48_00505 [Nocardioides sp.]|nr:hypothetical protein [Nocardioides sp.]
MNAGLPGTGIGGLFYVVLALLMPVRELYLTARGRSSRERWRLVLQQSLIACGIVASLAATWWGLTRVVDTRGAGGLGGTSILFAPAIVAATVLCLIVVTLRVWALLLGGPSGRHAS